MKQSIFPNNRAQIQNIGMPYMKYLITSSNILLPSPLPTINNKKTEYAKRPKKTYTFLFQYLNVIALDLAMVFLFVNNVKKTYNTISSHDNCTELDTNGKLRKVKLA